VSDTPALLHGSGPVNDYGLFKSMMNNNLGCSFSLTEPLV
jgi:hypothetical protein